MSGFKPYDKRRISQMDQALAGPRRLPRTGPLRDLAQLAFGLHFGTDWLGLSCGQGARNRDLQIQDDR